MRLKTLILFPSFPPCLCTNLEGGLTVEAQDVEELKLEVSTLRSRLADMTENVRELTKVVNGLVK